MSERNYCFISKDRLCLSDCQDYNADNKVQPCTVLSSLTRIARGTTVPVAAPQPPKVMP